MEHKGLCSRVQDFLNVCQGKVLTSGDSVYPFTQQHTIRAEIIIQRSSKQSGPGKAVSACLYSETKIDPKTGKGKLSRKGHLKKEKSNDKHDGTKIQKYATEFQVEADFGIPGAFLIENQHKDKFFLESVTVTLRSDTDQNIHFVCNSWIYPIEKTKAGRVFFSNKNYHPNQTPNGLEQLRKEELASLRGDGTGVRKEWERIYDYDVYNDLGNPEKVFGGSNLYPYPRRGRTGNSADGKETRKGKLNLNVYVPPDERFSPRKMSEFLTNSIQAALHFIIPEANQPHSSAHFESFDEILDLFTTNRSRKLDASLKMKLKNQIPDDILKMVEKESKEKPVSFPFPQFGADNKLAWKDDEEFGRQMLAGINPTVIQTLQTFPPVSKLGVRSSIKLSDIEHNLEGLTVAKAMDQWRIFILDHHDYLMPFLDRIDTRGVCAYASRALLFLRNDATLKPLAIELSSPECCSGGDVDENSRVFLPATEGTEAALWQQAKAHVAANDSAYHQLINHWLKTHAIVEPFIIATRRQLSVMHPIHWLLDPHFKDTMHANVLARGMLINSGGILEKTLCTGEFSMELSSALYKDWRFDEQSLPADLLKRRMALPDPDHPSGVQLLFEDYPYGADGLDIWVAIKDWVKNFCSLFYPDDNAVKSDSELQAWWSEIRNVGHGDKCSETWWYSMTTCSELTEALTTLIWTASALHASVNYGQYGYAGYLPNRPTKCRKYIPDEGALEFAEFLRDSDKYYLEMLPERFEVSLSMALVAVLSKHASDEVYLGQRPMLERTDKEVRKRFYQFTDELKEVEKRIMKRNRDPRLKNRSGPAMTSYKLLFPDTSNVGFQAGITGRGIPNSISI